ncbi:hypothetical protein OHA84_38105 (plasmid) [Streptomyces sp. NBC_00513]|uniref:DUF6573 family protein n=1 Tax=unclassified Streptomyces TaxID=2593676 RepID=UPI00225A4A1D|nr:DUF6573 family protein [Streptomyces sp. NBC_00424]MCX5078733.1 hypothetical protein [Streptomyces sp. NBC_00424]WUD46344.1 hypothetical protein OHA84_38105 [Streptomyces sp. NBC_00513]
MTDKTLIDGTANPDSLGPDAMRWTPEPEQPAVSVVDIFGEVIHGYSRADALADGALIAVGDDVAREAGFGVPVALTAAAWADCVAWNDEDNRQTCQDESGRLWDVLRMTRYAIRRFAGVSSCTVELYHVPRDGESDESERTWLLATCGPGDDREPVLTISLPDED